jgi:hypothetical protein
MYLKVTIAEDESQDYVRVIPASEIHNSHFGEYPSTKGVVELPATNACYPFS